MAPKTTPSFAKSKLMHTQPNVLLAPKQEAKKSIGYECCQTAIKGLAKTEEHFIRANKYQQRSPNQHIQRCTGMHTRLGIQVVVRRIRSQLTRIPDLSTRTSIIILLCKNNQNSPRPEHSQYGDEIHWLRRLHRRLQKANSCTHNPMFSSPLNKRLRNL